MDRANHSMSRTIQYLIVGFGLTLLYLTFRGTEWKGSGEVHTVMEVFATLLALTVGVLGLKKYYLSSESKFLIIGAGFLGTAFLDGYHALVTSAAIKVYLPSSWDSLIAWSWVASRLFLGVLLLFSYIVYKREQNLGLAGRISPKILYLFIGSMTGISFILFIVVPVPRAYYPEYMFHRPEEFLPAFFFLLALIGYLKKGEWKVDKFEHWLVVSLVINFISQVVFMSFSGDVFDFEFDAAHTLKKVSYVCVLIGLVLVLSKSLQESKPHLVIDENLRLSVFGTKLSYLVTFLIIFAMLVTSLVFFQDKFEVQTTQENELLQKDLEIISSLLQEDVDRLKGDVALLKNMPPISGIIRASKSKGFDKQGNSTIVQWQGRLKNIFTQYALARKSIESATYYRLGTNSGPLVELDKRRLDSRYLKDLTSVSFEDKAQVKVAYLAITQGELHTIVIVPVFDGDTLFGIVAVESKSNGVFTKIRSHLPEHQKLFIFNQELEPIASVVHKDSENEVALIEAIRSRLTKDAESKNKVIYLSSAKSEAFSVSTIDFSNGYLYNLALLTNYEFIYSSTQGSINKVLMAGGMILIFSLVLLWFMAYTLTSPLMYLSQTMQSYAKTGLLRDVPDQAKDEIGELARAFKHSVNQVERTIKDLETQTFALNEHSLVSMTDTKGKIIYANEKFCNVSQFSLDELLGKDHRLLNSGTHSKDFMKNLWTTIKSGEVWQGEVCNKAKDGSLYWVHATILGYKDLSGAISKFVAIRTDITAVKEAEANLKESKKVAELAVLDAQAANDSKSQFLANMSHEIRTPLNAVIGYTQLLMEEKLSFEQLKMMETVNKCSQTLQELINDILDLSKIEAGEMTLEKTPVDLIDLIYQVNEQSRPKLQGKDVELHVQADEILNFVMMDSTRTKQVLINLLGNAVKFTHAGQIITKLDILDEQKDQISLRLSVTDTGIGIPAEQLENIFSAFKQADGSTTRKYGGTGLGLNISRELIELMTSTIKVESSVGEGTTFYFELVVEKGDLLEQKQMLDEVQNMKLYCLDPNKFSEKVILGFARKYKITSESFVDVKSLLSAFDQDSSEQKFIFIGGSADSLPSLVDYRAHTVAMLNNINSESLSIINMNGFDSYILKPVREQDFLSFILRKSNTAKQVVEGPITQVEFENHTANVLLVEDNRINQKLCMKVLKKMGHVVSLAENGQEALDMLEKESFDIVLMDMQMPVMDGLEASSEIRKRGNDVPIIALTANVFESDRQACEEAGMNDFATKPLQKNLIKKLIEKYTHAAVPEEQLKQLVLVEDDRTSAEIMKHIFKEEFPEYSVNTACTGVEACSMIGRYQPEVIVLDIDLPDLDGVEVLKFLETSKDYEQVKVVLYSGLPDTDARLIEARTHRHFADLGKTTDRKKIVETIKSLES